MDYMWGDQQLRNDHEIAQQLPSELLDLILKATNSEYLDALAAAALSPALTDKLFSCYEPVFIDICGRWMTSSNLSGKTLASFSAFARVLPFAPQLLAYAEVLVLRPQHSPLKLLSSGYDLMPDTLSELELQEFLLATFRLLTYKNEIFAQLLSMSRLQLMLQHDSRTVRYLGIRLICLYMHAADAPMEDMVKKYLGMDAIPGEWEGRTIDYEFLSLWEEKRSKDLKMRLDASRTAREAASASINPKRRITQDDFSEYTADVGGIQLPRAQGRPSSPSSLVLTPTVTQNVRALARALLHSNPILLAGATGSGKTSLVAYAARTLNMAESMVTLHLNEQTDAKLLIGMYTTTTTPGSFTWRPGILTTAVREGRWVLIEDLDRAPTEVMSVILPLVERGELLIPNQGETIRAAQGFRLLATIRTAISSSGKELLPKTRILGNRFWRRVVVQMPNIHEIRIIVSKSFPLVHAYEPMIIRVFDEALKLYSASSFATQNKGTSGRPLSSRDLFKWCRRIQELLVSAGAKTGDEPLPEKINDDIFMEAADCFAASLQSESAKIEMLSCIAKQMHVAPQRVQYYFHAHVPRYNDTDKILHVGRVRLPKPKTFVGAKARRASRMPFAASGHALRLLEQVGIAVYMAEPILLVGETGTGKTTVVQQLADLLGIKLTVVNLSQQSEAGDLLGGFKPLSTRSIAIPMKEEFDDLFASTFTVKRNQAYLDKLNKCIAKGRWSLASKFWAEAVRMSEDLFGSPASSRAASKGASGEQPKKRRKMELPRQQQLKDRWGKFAQDLKTFDLQLSSGPKGFAFGFVEGNIIKAARYGGWVLLDEINLASPETLESIADLLCDEPGGSPSILLSETGTIERVQAHPQFRIFGAMNPATDFGKRDLSMGLRSRFTEIYVESPDRNLVDLLIIVKVYLGGFCSGDERVAHDVANLYLEVKQLAEDNKLVDGANQRPHFSLRTLSRTLTYALEITSMYGLRRALYEGFSMSFLSLLDKDSERLIAPLIVQHILGDPRHGRSLLRQTPRLPDDDNAYVSFKHYWIPRGPFEVEAQPQYIITPFIESNLLNLVRAISTRQFPILVQGPTSSGKTSMIEYLAKLTGNKYIRINNHEHTDLQEYLGTYISNQDGQLKFQEGVLVQALHEGHWIVLDELNLAPTDVLEALNRLLDDNRELLIPETQEIVRPHPKFMLFATQNPPGLYGGRKVLSRALRNRFLELHFDEIPKDELETILRERSQIAPSFCAKIVEVYNRLSLLRQTSRLFEQKNSFATLRDLFRWASREADGREELAVNGFMLLAERVRNCEERFIVKSTIEEVMKVKISEGKVYDLARCPEARLADQSHAAGALVWTRAMTRLYILVCHALRNNEPVLLVGETGSGKTTVCQMLAQAFGKTLHAVNAHQNTETGDLIGAQRPLRNRSAIEKQLYQDIAALLTRLGEFSKPDENDLDSLLRAYEQLEKTYASSSCPGLVGRIESNKAKLNALFEWSDGNLVRAMKTGQFFMLDEISLADDSVLERLNSVLEPQRSLLLAEKGQRDSFIVASEGFQFLATMNPGGDYGKRELSPALRNRFTEIWVPPVSYEEDVLQIARTRLLPCLKGYSDIMVSFARWFSETYHYSASSSISIRDILAWVEFVNICQAPQHSFSIFHGAAMIFIDTLGANPAAKLAISQDSVHEERKRCLVKLSELLQQDAFALYSTEIEITDDGEHLQIGKFSISKANSSADLINFNLNAPTTKVNAMRVVRALQLRKPILLEGNPGVGKTTLITALAQTVGKPLVRVNLSEQTDLMDLFGTDVPVDGAHAGHFSWRDAPFLQAMQRGDWVLLDEMNLASQSVLEGLNACLDHRGEVYIPELDQTFRRHPSFAVFAAQNPHHQGAGRKGLPASFVNRFTVVYVDTYSPEDLQQICEKRFPKYSRSAIAKQISYVAALEDQVTRQRKFGALGGPWEFNLRDIIRWLELLNSQSLLLPAGSPADFLDLLFTQRFRTLGDRLQVQQIFTSVYGEHPEQRSFFHNLGRDHYQVGLGILPRYHSIQPMNDSASSLTKDRLSVLESLLICIQQGWPTILVGPSGSGKTSLLRHAAAMSGSSLTEFALHSDIDTMDLVGGYEQVDPQRRRISFLNHLEIFLRDHIMSSCIARKIVSQSSILLELVQSHLKGTDQVSGLKDILSGLNILASYTDCEDALLPYIYKCNEIMHDIDSSNQARFEWVDGVLIQALEQGNWLVLDNANLCSSSVLDRLNSLLEPNGCLSISEHPGPDGSARMVKPHSSFRLFLTMDPKYGELSRAMRNRAVEIFLPGSEALATISSFSPLQIYDNESSIYRLRLFGEIVNRASAYAKVPNLTKIGLDHLSLSDMQALPRWYNQVCAGLLALPDPSQSDILSVIDSFVASPIWDVSQEMKKYYNAVLMKSDLKGGFDIAQAVHPLTNSPLLALHQYKTSDIDPYWLATLRDLLLEITSLQQMLTKCQQRSQSIRVSEMTRLERSFASHRTQILAKDLTMPISLFLQNYLRTISEWIKTNWHCTLKSERALRLLKGLLPYWCDMFEVVNRTTFDDGTFQVFLSLGQAMVSEDVSMPPSVYALMNELRSQLNQIKIKWQLTTGLSMTTLWSLTRARTPSTIDHLHTILHLEQLADRFDALIWRSRIPLIKLGNIRQSISDAFRIVLLEDAPGDSLIEVLEDTIANLEAEPNHHSKDMLPYFKEDFEGLIQLRCLDGRHSSTIFVQRDLDPMVSLLACRPTRSVIVDDSGPASLFSRLVTLFGNRAIQKPYLTLQDSLNISMLHKFHRLGLVDLGHLNLLQEELDALGQCVAQCTGIIGIDQLQLLNGDLKLLIIQIFKAHPTTMGEGCSNLLQSMLSNPRELEARTNTESMEQFISNVLHNTVIPSGHYFHHVLQDFLLPSVFYLGKYAAKSNDSYRNASKAWVYFAFGCLLLYVPDKAFDPALKPSVERQRHLKRKSELQITLEALHQVQEVFTAQHTNIRCLLIEEELRKLGQTPSVPAIARPLVSKLSELQGEFMNLLRAIILPRLEQSALLALFEGDTVASHEVNLLRKNIDQIIKRLTEGHREYDDLTSPVVGMLHSLDIGLALATFHTSSASASSVYAHKIMRQTPFLGGSLTNYLFQSQGLLTSGPDSDYHSRLHFLKTSSIAAKVYGITHLEQQAYQQMAEIFHSFYFGWKDQLEQDQKISLAASGLYRYRGGDAEDNEVNEGAFRELFPSYDSQDSNLPMLSKSKDPKQLASEMANLHEDIFSSQSAPCTQILALLIKSAAQLSNTSMSGEIVYSHQMAEDQISGVIMSLHEKVQGLKTMSDPGNTYDFYRDANIGEAKKSAALIHKVKHRFKQLKDAWPEHATLQDVLNTSEDLLAFKHVEPVAKYLTKVEKLHGYIHEWEIVASREFSAGNLYKELTSLIVNWRRLELATWAQLFNIEDQKCCMDANSWWFIAYEVIIAVPLSLSNTQRETAGYAQELLVSLETFFSTTSMGQFSQRLKLLNRFKEHVAILAGDVKPLKAILSALRNFISYYSRFEYSVTETLAKGRASLEKDMKQVVLLASWKDTNIDALRESAKRSHHKLFKLVRKYRALLAQPVDLLKHAVHEHNQASVPETTRAFSEENVDINSRAMLICQASVPRWVTKPERFINVEATVTTMKRMGRLPILAINVSDYCEDFLSTLVTSIEALRKETPATLTKETTDLLGHLKSRKRKLLADTLKDLRQMGINSNLSSETWSEQESLSVVLATTPAFDFKVPMQAISVAEMFFHKSLELMPTVKNSIREHSDDLTNNEVARCVGYAGGFLSLVLKQRLCVSNSTNEITKLEAVVEQISSLWAPEEYSIQPEGTSTASSNEELRHIVFWLPHIIEAAIEIIRVHAGLSKIDSPKVAVELQEWADRIANLVMRWNALPKMPLRLTTTMHNALYRDTQACVKEFRGYLLASTASWPLGAFALKQVLLWTECAKTTTNSEVASNGIYAVNISELDKSIAEACDSALVAMQQVQEALLTLPSSTDDPGWMIKQERSLAAVVKAFRVSSVVRMLENAVSQITHLDLSDEDVARTTAALFAAILPIVRQYRSLYNEAVERYSKAHRSTCEMAYTLMKSFIQIAKQGFCMPAEKSSKGDTKSEKLDSGTGLGEGEGADDISKDIQEDEDLSELAQQPESNGDKDQIEDEKDAVDMNDVDMEGEMDDISNEGEIDENGGNEKPEEEHGNEIDEEAGDVDDLDPSAVDEKLWDGGKEEGEKDQKGDQSKGKKQKDEQAASNEDVQVEEAQEGREDDELEENGVQENETINRDEPEKIDPHLKDDERLELPDAMELDGVKQPGSESGSEASLDDENMDELSDLEQNGAEEEEVKARDMNDDVEMDMNNLDLDAEEEPDSKTEDVDPDAEVGEDDVVDESRDGLLRDHDRDTVNDANAAMSSDSRGTVDDQDHEDDDKQEPSSNEKRSEGAQAGSSGHDPQDSAPQEGQLGQVAQSSGHAGHQNDQSEDSTESQAFKKLGNALEHWHRQQREIQNASKQNQETSTQTIDNQSKASEFEHLLNDEAQPDTQALGSATEDQAHALDESKALDSEASQPLEDFLPDEKEQPQEGNHASNDEESQARVGKDNDGKEQPRPGAFIGPDQDKVPRLQHQGQGATEDEDNVKDIDEDLSTRQLEPSETAIARSEDEARLLWNHYENITRSLSLSLTEQLRLILAPTVATKMRGDFRTGKRLNLKRIIPYIASQYKRDKIWMRRSVPSKRNYQIMLAVDDSKSMGESGSGELAFETLALVAKSLSMLDVGEICILGFGSDVTVAHAFDTPFTSVAGGNVFQQFGFQQTRTDVRKLVAESIELFREARNKSMGSNSGELWQLELIISDGVCQDHDIIRRLVRQAQEERIMIVFVIVDALRGESIMEMKEARFEPDESGDTKLMMKRYLDGFPFNYYLVVGDVKELPAVLATALRQWFAEVVDAGG